MSRNPTVVVVPGAWHPASCVDPFCESLKKDGFPSKSITLRSVGNADISVSDDVAHIKSVIEPLVQGGEDVILIVHSYAGFPGTGAIAGLDKKGIKARGEKGGVLGIVFLASFVPLEGETLVSLLGGSLLWWMTDNREARLIEAHSHSEVFYHDCSPEHAAAASATLKGHSTMSWNTTVSAIGWRDSAYDGCRAYIRCLDDKALLPNLQDFFVERSKVSWIVKDLDASHSPFMSIPDQLTGVVKEIVAGFKSAMGERK